MARLGRVIIAESCLAKISVQCKGDMEAKNVA